MSSMWRAALMVSALLVTAPSASAQLAAPYSAAQQQASDKTQARLGGTQRRGGETVAGRLQRFLKPVLDHVQGVLAHG